MDWSNEDYVRMYTRDTSDDLLLSWQAVALWRAMLCKFDRAGLIATRRGSRGLAALVRMPPDVVESALAELLIDGRVQAKEVGYFAPNFLLAQTATKSDKQRQRESREKRAADTSALPNVNQTNNDVTNRDSESQNVTVCHENAGAVTRGHTPSHPVTLTSALLCSADPLLRVALGEDVSASPPLQPTSEPNGATMGGVSKPRSNKRKGAQVLLPEDWEPRPQELAKARAMGLDGLEQAERFRNHHGAKGSLFADWHKAYRSWLDKAQDWSAGRNGHRGPQRSIADIAMERALEAEAREKGTA